MSPTKGSLRTFVENWKASFGAGCVPFDTAYLDATRNGASWAAASQKGVHALLDALVEEYEQGEGGDVVPVRARPGDEEPLSDTTAIFRQEGGRIVSGEPGK